MLKEITLENIEAVDWSDVGLERPQRGKAYAQIITLSPPGYPLVPLDGTGYCEYHVDNHLRGIYYGEAIGT